MIRESWYTFQLRRVLFSAVQDFSEAAFTEYAPAGCAVASTLSQ
jgi:hypothetical protein